ncbi:MAG: hypothetical protein WD049_08740 [Candidatus Paceibacterota bacterium]
MTIRGQRALKIATGVIVLCLLAGYGAFQARHMISGPVVAIQSPHNGATIHTSLVTIEGTTANISAIRLNDRAIYINEQGAFEEPVVLARGYNVITISATDRFGREVTDTVEVVHTPLGRSVDDRLSQDEARSADTINES